MSEICPDRSNVSVTWGEVPVAGVPRNVNPDMYGMLVRIQDVNACYSGGYCSMHILNGLLSRVAGLATSNHGIRTRPWTALMGAMQDAKQENPSDSARQIGQGGQ
jgi:hypothetical protein